ncbi:hypothetical protein PtA15_13A497 [Puccinia triticina]|uniref:Uncharacterized protein n=1 Tax=Puccinia triticina TaxID=208348 RepID=A0ABY7D109_9BASI|nr:uncharacterized protein PtA15_13A497 [Puccinia triticina]WAQ91096.1 hypothetical protein PtA15_13A497 [Puccinia triticina]
MPYQPLACARLIRHTQEIPTLSAMPSSPFPSIAANNLFPLAVAVIKANITHNGLDPYACDSIHIGNPIASLMSSVSTHVAPQPPSSMRQFNVSETAL